MSTIVNYKKGEVVYLEGSFEMAMYHILKGSVLVYANYKKDSEMLLKEQKEGDYFGQLDLIEAIPRSASIIANDDVILERISGDEFGSYLSERPDEYMIILNKMSSRLREIGDSLHEVYLTIDEYLNEEKKSTRDESFLKRLSKIINISKWSKE